jgi:hypothetical protein
MISTITTAEEACAAILDVMRRCEDGSHAQSVAEAGWRAACCEMSIVRSAQRGHRYVAIRRPGVEFFMTFEDARKFASENPGWEATCSLY